MPRILQRDHAGHHVLGDLEGLFSLVDGWGDGRGADDVRLQRLEAGAQRIGIEVMGHRVDEMDVGVARFFERAGLILVIRKRFGQRIFQCRHRGLQLRLVRFEQFLLFISPLGRRRRKSRDR